MPGPQDQGDQIELPRAHSPDGARSPDSPGPGDRPERGSIADLRQRLKYLPHGHPSSPYHDDGTPKPLDARLENLELPLPGETRESNGGVRRDASALRVATPWAGDRAEPAEADAGPVTFPRSDVQDRQPAVREPDPALPNREPEGSKPADQEPAGAKPEAADQDSARESIWERRPVRETTSGQPDLVQDQRPTLEHEPDPHDEEPAPGADADLHDDEPATQDQPAITDDQAPPAAEAEISAAGRAESLTPEQIRLAVRTLGQCRLAEGRNMFGSYGEEGLTPAMRRIEDQLENGELVPDTEKYALKSLDSFQEKLADMIADEPGANPEELADGIHDGIRYTFLFDADNYTQGVDNGRAKLAELGYSLQLLRNTWNQDQYKGINSRWFDPTSGKMFEVQFHTPYSWEVKQQTHDAYKRIQSLPELSPEREQLKAYQHEMTASIPIPAGCLVIANYPKEG